jgi:hypothetical protein
MLDTASFPSTSADMVPVSSAAVGLDSPKKHPEHKSTAESALPIHNDVAKKRLPTKTSRYNVKEC